MNRGMIPVLFVVLLMTQRASAAIVYSNDFEGAVGSEWSDTQVGTTPIGNRKFLGPFPNDGVTRTLTLSGLTPHANARVSLDLFIILSWDGNLQHTPGQPDEWRLRVADGPTLLDATFDNGFPWTVEGYPQPNQSYPFNYDGSPIGQKAPMTGAIETRTLGYTHPSLPGQYMDAVYHLDFQFAHTSDTLVLEFWAFGAQPPWNPGHSDEMWGVDNVEVRTNAVPEPSSLIAWTILGVVGAAVTRRARKNA